MCRNFYILAASLAVFALIAGGMSLVPSSFQPGLPANASPWRTTGILLPALQLKWKQGRCFRP